MKFTPTILLNSVLNYISTVQMAGHQTEERPVSQGDVNLPPGTFQLFSGKRLFLLRFMPTNPLIDDLYETEGRRAVILSPIPSNDPNEPLVSFIVTIHFGITILIETRIGVLSAKLSTSPLCLR